MNSRRHARTTFRASDCRGLALPPPGPDDFRGLRRIANRLGDDFLTGVVLYTGASTLPFGDKLRAMPISALWQLPAPVEN
jgi:hypothetical protein